MLELYAKNEQIEILDLFIERVNYIKVFNHVSLFSFMDIFFNRGERDLFINNVRVDLKNSFLVNLLDYESICNQLTLKKGTIIYEYLIDELVECSDNENVKEETEFFIKEKIREYLDKSIEYEFNFDIDISKIINNYVRFDIDLSLKNYIGIIKILIEKIHEKNPRKRIIIFVNYKLFGDLLNDIDDATVFIFNSSCMPTILIGNEIQNFDKDILANNLILNWPCDISREEALGYIAEYMKQDMESQCQQLSYKEFVAFALIEKITQFGMKFILKEEPEIPPLYKKYIDDLL